MIYIKNMRKSLPIQDMRKAKKMREFREYLADSGVVLAMVKFLLSLKQSSTPIENPAQFIQDYFGFYRDEKSQMMEEMGEDMKRLEQEVSEKEEEVLRLKKEVDLARKSIVVTDVFKIFETEQVSTKQFVQKLSGQGKFDLDFKLSKNSFVDFIIQMIDGASLEEVDENWNALFIPFKESIGLGPDGKPKPPFFAGRLDDPNYLRIIEKIREFAASN